jgi:hypothetical protein
MVITVSTAMGIHRIKVETVSFSEHLLPVLFVMYLKQLFPTLSVGVTRLYCCHGAKNSFRLLSFKYFLFCVWHESGPIYLFKDCNLPGVSWFIVTHIQLNSIFVVCFT